MKSPSEFFKLSPMKQKKILKKVVKQSSQDQMKVISKAQHLYNALKDNPAEVIAWAEAEIREYERLI